MNLYIIRHAESTWNKLNRIQGHSNPPLSSLGKIQARLLAKRFKGIKIDKIYSSPLLRSLQTAQIISKALEKRIIKNQQLREVMLGDWEGKTAGDIDRMYNNKYQKWLRNGPTKVRIPGAENISSFRNRVRRTVYKIVDENQEKDVIVVTHGGVIAAFLAHILDADFDKLILGLHLPNTCVTLISFQEGRNCLIHIADTHHLSAAKEDNQWPK